MHIIKGQIYRLMRVLRILGGVKYGIVYYIGFSTLIPASPAEKRRLAGDGKYEKGAMPVEDMILTLLSKPNPNAPAKVVKR